MNDRAPGRAQRQRFDPRRMPLAEAMGVWTLAGLDDYKRLVASAYLFWPDFVEVDGCILLAEMYDAGRFAEWMSTLGGERERVERVINEVSLGDLLMNQSPENDRELGELTDWAADALAELAEVLASCWRGALADRFPDRGFHVGVDYRAANLPAVFFYTRRPRGGGGSANPAPDPPGDDHRRDAQQRRESEGTQ
jgi:hypothetical protein